MSMHLNWIAAEVARPDLLNALGFRETGASFDPRAADFACVRTSKGWQVVVGRSMKLKLDRPPPALTAAGGVLTGEASDIVMLSRLQAWRADVRLWSVTHDPEDGVEGLATEGDLAPNLSGIAARLSARQAEETEPVDHLFDAPLEIGGEICGFRPDEPQPGPWILLSPAPSSQGPRSSSLPAAIRAEILPGLADLGWTVAPIQCASNGRAYEASRLRNGRLEYVALLWRDDRRDLAVTPSFAMLESDRPDAPVIVSGSIHRPRPSLLQRIGSWRPGRPAKSYEDKVRDAIVEARADLPSIDRSIDDSAAAVLG